MAELAVIDLADGRNRIAIGGVRVNRLLSSGLFREAIGLPSLSSPSDISDICHDKWTDLAATLISIPEPIEILMLLGHDGRYKESGDLVVAFLAIGRGNNRKTARSRCLRAHADLWTLLVTTLDYAELQTIEDSELLERLLSGLKLAHIHEIRRRLEGIPVSQGVIAPTSEPVGFVKMGKRPCTRGRDSSLIDNLFPWVPSDDPWRRMMEVLAAQDKGAFILVHIQGWKAAPKAAVDCALRTMAATERVILEWLDPALAGKTVFTDTAKALRQEALARLAILKGGVVAARVFLATHDPANAGLLATVVQSLDDASVRRGQPGAESLFRGGAKLKKLAGKEILASLERPTLDMLFGPREATAFLRTPMPTDSDLPGLPMNRARTALFVGRSGGDCNLGANIHRAANLPVSLEHSDRFRHTYVVGQTGTGKSTLLLHMILHDIREGRGVAVLDPHGTLIEDVISRFPPSRIDDVVLLDVSDIERPIGFNMLRIDEKDPIRYRAARDYLIDDIFGYLAGAYDLKMVGGPIFESHFRSMLALLLGTKSPEPPLVPSLMVFRALYTNEDLLNNLSESMADTDPVIDEFIRETKNVYKSSEGSLRNIAPYITAKFSRFISDATLRNITCQREILDLDDIVNTRKILLFYLGRGRFGDYAAGLLASQIVARIRHIVMRRGAKGVKKPFYLYADEFQLFADGRFGELLAEARKFGLSLTLAHQYAGQLPDAILEAVLGNVGTTIAFRVGSPDAERLESLYAPQFSRRDLMALPNYRAYVRSTGSLGEMPFSLETPAPPEIATPAIASEVRKRSRERYGRDRAVVEAEIRETYAAYGKFKDKDASETSEDSE